MVDECFLMSCTGYGGQVFPNELHQVMVDERFLMSCTESWWTSVS